MKILARTLVFLVLVLPPPIVSIQALAEDSEKNSWLKDLYTQADDVLSTAGDLTKKTWEVGIKVGDQIVSFSSEQLSELLTVVENELSDLESTPDSKVDIEQKFYELRLFVDDLTELKEKEREAPNFALLSKTKKDYRIKMDEVLKELEPILFDGEVMGYSTKIRKAQTQIKVLQSEIFDLKEKKLFADLDDKDEFDGKIVKRVKGVKSLETLIGKLEYDLMKKFHRLGIDLSIEQVRVVTKRVDGDDLAHTLAVFDITRQISSKLAELMENADYDPEYARRYYGIYVVMAEMVLYSQRVYAKRINEIYLVALDQLERDIQDAINFAEQSISKQKNEANVKILKQNIESNKFSNEVVDMYREILLAQEENLKKAMKDSKNNVDVAYSTFDTVTISSNLVNLIDTTQDEFNKVMNMQIPQIVPFENKILEERFVHISNKISAD
jgi:hypothetical protein